MMGRGETGLVAGEGEASAFGLSPDARGERRAGVTVRRPAPPDAASLAVLWAEMQEHYGQPVAPEAAAAAAAFACRAALPAGFDPRFLLAVTDAGEVVGAIALNVTFPAAELTRSLYIRDLYVSEAARRRSVARCLLRAAAALAVAEGFSALDWTADARNAGARLLYERCGAVQLARVYYRLAGTGLLAVANGCGAGQPLDSD